uniref:NB-ARC domain-containing protein n=1 Tax=Oryza glaberrima TaxID=4538 RepID=I1NZP7_ORYGL
MAYVEFPALKKLQLHDLESFESWVATPGKEELSFPVLEEIDIRNCPKLTSLPGPPKGVLTSSSYGGAGQVIQSRLIYRWSMAMTSRPQVSQRSQEITIYLA